MSARILIGILLFAFAFAQSTLAQWTPRNLAPSADYLNDVAVGDGVAVAVGERGTVMRSLDGISWSRVTTGTEDNLRKIAWGAGKFVAVGDDGYLLSSPDGLHWTVQRFASPPSAGPIVFHSVTFGAGKFAAFGGGFGFTSTDGENWTRLALSLPIGPVTFAGGYFYSLGWLKFHRSLDGVNWTEVWNPSSLYYAITYANGLFVAVGQSSSIPTSTDGVNWTLHPTPAASGRLAICSGPTGFVAVGRNTRVATSPDGIAWTINHLNPTVGEFRAVQYFGGAYIAVSEHGIIHRSVDGITWDEVPDMSLKGTLYTAAKGNGRIIAMGPGWTIRSDDGVTWVNGGTLPSNDEPVLAYGNGVFVAGAGDRIFTSTDGLAWTLREDISPSETLSNVRYLNGKFIAVSNNAIRSSVDGVQWSKHEVDEGAPFLRAVTYGSGKYVVIARSIPYLDFYTSVDGIAWTRVLTELAAEILDLTFVDGMFVGVGSPGFAFTRIDGTTWTRRNIPTNETLVSICRGARRFVAVGSNGSVASSLDGITWEVGYSGTAKSLNEVIALETGFLAVGDRGTVLWTPDSDAPSLTAPQIVVSNPGAPIAFDVTSNVPNIIVTHLTEGIRVDTSSGAFRGVAPAEVSARLITVTAPGPLASAIHRFNLIVPRTYTAWSQQHFNEPARPYTEDGDRDNVINLFEYASGTNPTIAPVFRPPSPFTFYGGVPSYSFTRDVSALDAAWAIEATEDFRAWRVVAKTDEAHQLISVDPNFVVVDLSVDTLRPTAIEHTVPAPPHLFLRVRLVAP